MCPVPPHLDAVLTLSTRNPNISHHIAAIFPLLRGATSDMDPFESESPTQQNLCGDRRTDDSVEFPTIRPKNLIRLGEDSLRTSLIPATGMSYPVGAEGRRYLSLISDMILRDRTSPTGLSPAEAAALVETPIF